MGGIVRLNSRANTFRSAPTAWKRIWSVYHCHSKSHFGGIVCGVSRNVYFTSRSSAFQVDINSRNRTNNEEVESTFYMLLWSQVLKRWRKAASSQSMQGSTWIELQLKFISPFGCPSEEQKKSNWQQHALHATVRHEYRRTVYKSSSKRQDR